MDHCRPAVCLSVLDWVRGTYAVNTLEFGEGSRPHWVISAYRVMDNFRDVYRKHWSIPTLHFGNRTERDTRPAGRPAIIVSRSGYRPSDGRPLYHVDIRMFSFHATKDAGCRKLITLRSYCSLVSDVRTHTGAGRGIQWFGLTIQAINRVANVIFSKENGKEPSGLKLFINVVIDG